MISGTIIGEIRTAMIARRNGTGSDDSPSAASVPKLTARSVAIGAIFSEFHIACCQSEVLKKSS